MTRQGEINGALRETRRPLGLLKHDRKAVAAVEMALVGAIVFLPILGGITGFGQALLMQNMLDRALHAAVLTGYAPPSPLTTANVQSTMSMAVRNGYGPTATPSTTASLSYYCISTTGNRKGSGSATIPSCTSPKVVATYLVVSTSVSFIPLINVGISGWNESGGTGGAVTISANATVRIQ
jgi:hypothetical protein